MSPNPQPKREKQMEGKIRERERRAFTARMIDGLRQHGNYNLPAVQNSKPSNEHERNSNPNPQPAGAIMGDNAAASTSGNKSRKEREKQMEHMFRERDRRAFTTRIIDGLRQHGNYNLPTGASMNQVLVAVVNEAGYIVGPDGTTYRPPPPSNVVVGNSSKNCSTSASVLRIDESLSPASFDSLVLLKSLNIDGVVVNCWWGIVERRKNQKYEWSGYRELFDIIRDMELKLQVVMAFNAYAGNDFNVDIPLPEWVLKIGKDNPEIFFTDRVGRWNTDCLSWGIDRERILEHRTGQEVYYEFMRSFRAEFTDLFTGGLIDAVEIGLGASGELKYPSFSERNGWRFPGIGEFQVSICSLHQSL
nr:beta-amylase 8 [Ipomoea batatas]